MKIAIIDGVNQDIGLKILFPEADYYINNTEINKKDSILKYNIEIKSNWNTITDKNYDYLFIVISLYDAKPGVKFYKQNIYDILQKELEIINNNNFKKVFIFDNYDYDYDPNTIIKNNKIDLFFKRHYNKTKKYEDNVIPFPFIMFGSTALIEKIDNKFEFNRNETKINRVLWTGALYCHTDNEYLWLRNRQLIYSQIISSNGNFLYNPGRLPYNLFLNEINKSKFTLDLLGVGCPNMKTFEILTTNSLRISQYSDLFWPFPEQFSEETIFKDSNEYIKKIHKLIQNEELYQKCLKNQQNIVNKYFNKNWIKEYILKYIKWDIMDQTDLNQYLMKQ